MGLTGIRGRQTVNILIGWITTVSRADAEKLARDCIGNGLAIRAQVEGPITSFFSWRDGVEREEEFKVTFKFPAESEEKLEAWLKENHPYDVLQWIAPGEKWDDPLAAALSGRTVSAAGEHAKVRSLKRSVIELSKLGNELLKKKDYQAAEEIFLEALAEDGENAYVLVGLGDLSRELKKYDAAIDFYGKVLEFDPANIFALRGIGDSYRGLRQPMKAILFWARYLEYEERDVHVMVRLADSYRKMEKFAESESFYVKALAVDDNDEYALLGLGSLYYKTGKDEKALACFDKLLALDGNYVVALTMAGNICRRNKEFGKAVVYYEKAAAYEPGNTFALYGLGDCHRGMENFAEAVRWWSKILEKEPENQTIHSRVGDILLSLNKLDEAMGHYRKSLSVGFDPYAQIGLSKIYRQRRNFSEAENCCRQILSRVPGHARGLEELAKIVEDKGEPITLAP